jgi:hypothetical protein
VHSSLEYATNTTGKLERSPGKSPWLLLPPISYLILCRHKIHPIISRLGIDTLAGRMARIREDDRFKAVGPDSVVFPHPQSHGQSGLKSAGVKAGGETEGEIWFDWAFVDFFKSNYCSLFLMHQSLHLLTTEEFRYGAERVLNRAGSAFFLHLIQSKCGECDAHRIAEGCD